MSIRKLRPLTPSSRYITYLTKEEVTKSRPEKSLTVIKKKSGGRNSYGRVTARGIGGGHKQRIRIVDFKRRGVAGTAEVIGVEYDPTRSANVALVKYADGTLRYILAPVGLEAGMTVESGDAVAAKLGNALSLKNIPLGSQVHNIELVPGKGGQIVRSAGSAATLMSTDAGYAQLRLPSGEIRLINENCWATVGQVGNTSHENVVLGKAGRNRYLGKRPITRGVSRNPVDHPMGGGAGKTSGGGHPVSPWGLPSKGYKTRKPKLQSDKLIITRRNGKLFKRS